jgi:catechol 2,3-dioxygenase-like lactoylglutathione lyase family enzyme
MAVPVPPPIGCDRLHPGLRVPDVPAAAAFYTDRLGFNLGFTWGDPVAMAGVNLGDVQVFLERGPPSEGMAVYFVVDDADGLYAFHRGSGVEIVEPLDDRPYGMRDYMVRDPHGHRLGFGHYIPIAAEPVPIERVDVPVRLEKRLAALVHDLAAHKRMSVDSLLEEILLHTNEPLGDGVASPHTRSQLRYIQQLKARHGIDYDSHASYGWVEG